MSNRNARLPIHLYAGPDIEHTVALSDVPLKAGDIAAGASGVPARTRSLAQLRSFTAGALKTQTRVLSGVESVSGEILRLRFHGHARALPFVARHIFGNETYASVAASAKDPADIVVDYHPLGLAAVCARPGAGRLLYPLWVDQCLALGPVWADTLAGLGARRQKELRRQIRRHEPSLTLVRGEQVLRLFHQEMLQPHTRARFDNEALLETTDAFVARHRDALLLQISTRGAVVAANLLDVGTDTLAIRKAAIVPGAADGPWADLLDFYSIALAQRLACRRVDFGATRAHLDDGVLRYKAKWRARVQRQTGLKAPFKLSVSHDSAATRGFLSRNRFLVIGKRGLGVRLLADAAHTLPAEVHETARLSRSLGLARPVVVCLRDKPMHDELASATFVDVVSAATHADLLERYLDPRPAP